MIAIGSDHGGFELKQEIMKHLSETGVDFKDYGTYDTKSCDYPDYAEKVCAAVVGSEAKYGILICGTGIGISIAANKINGIRAALCSDCFSAKYTRRHNDANVICFGGRTIGAGLACELVDVF
ncbi:MAG: ribose 5-phosphate isomerase B, partial [Oscillospiraceae bacterium]